MTRLMEKAIERLAAVPETEQDRLARRVIEELDAAGVGSGARESASRNEDEVAEWLEVETHKMRGIPYPPE